MSNDIINIKSLSKVYDKDKILENIDFSLKFGEIVSIMGKSGIGKTTFINILLGLDFDYSCLYKKNFSKVSCVFQEDRLLNWLSVYENIKLVNKDISDNEIFEVLNMLDLLEYKDFMPKKLSGGMRQRVAIARAICYGAELIVMDEPLKSTDKEHSDKILNYLKEKAKREKIALVIVTHDFDNAIKISDRVLILDGKPSRFVENINLSGVSCIDSKREFLKTSINKIINKEKIMNRLPGHHLLARIGKTKLRPGGKIATDWLIEKANITSETKVLEVACNMGTTLVNVAKTYGCNIVGVDMNEQVLEKAKQNVKANGLEDKVTIKHADARNLPFEDESFDLIINEAMLTMLSMEDKKKAISEYFRVLKKGGILLTHDINLPSEDKDFIDRLRKVISVPATPLSEESWIKLYKSAGFSSVETKTDNMIFLSEKGLIADEGFDGMMNMYKRVATDPCYEQFVEMKRFFVENEDELYYIATVSKK